MVKECSLKIRVNYPYSHFDNCESSHFNICEILHLAVRYWWETEC